MILLISSFQEIFTAEFWGDIWKNIVTWFFAFGKNILLALVLLFVGTRIIKWIIKLIDKNMHKSRIEPTVCKFLVSLIKFALYAVLIIGLIGILGIPTSSLIAALSAVGLTIGLALQGSLSNFAGGVLILIFKPFIIGDYIYEDTHQNEGTVTGIDLFYTKLLSIDNKTVVIPNGTLANSSLVNFTTQKKRRIDLKVGISYESNIKEAKDVLEKVMREEKAILPNEPVNIYVHALEDSQVTIGTRAWVNTDDYWPTRWALMENFKIALDEAGIEIPFNQVTVSYKQEKGEDEIVQK